MSARPINARPVVVVTYDPEWPGAFAALREVYVRTLGDLATRIEHVGSTAVPGLAAKPIIDIVIVIVIATRDALPEVIDRLAGLGYHHEGDLGITGREAFRGDGCSDTPRDGSGRQWPEHHLYICAEDCDQLRRMVRFRDWLRAHPDDARAYGLLKRRLAALYGRDREGYTQAKTAFIEGVLATAAADDH